MAEQLQDKTEQKAEKLEAGLVAVAQTFEERQTAYAIASAYRRSQMIAQASAQVAETSWGTKLTPQARAAVVRYALETGTDPVRHWYVLGGKMYDNAELYYDLVASTDGFVKDDVDFIHDDEKLPPEERTRRLGQRQRYAAPDEAKGIAVVTLYFKDRGPFIGVNWAGRGRKTNDGKWADPVGEAEPTKTAHTRAYRKAAKKAVPVWFLKHPALKGTEEVVAAGRVVEDVPAAVAVGTQKVLAAGTPVPAVTDDTPSPGQLELGGEG